MDESKSLGLDGCNSKIYMEAWSTMGPDVIEALQSFFQNGKLLKTWNTATITLIPKVSCPTHLGDFRPISCCHALYKCISNLICSHLKRVLGSIVNQNQGAFVAGRLISHNILLCHDLVKHYSRKNSYPSCMIKVDLRKAYDTQFIKITMVCTTSIQYSLLINGSPSEIFKPKRSLSQGDPLSPLLFVIEAWNIYQESLG